MIVPVGINMGNAMLYSRGLQPPNYRPSLFDVRAVWFRLFDAPPVIVKTVQLKLREPMAAKDSVTIRISAEDAGAFEEWRKAAKGPEMVGDAIEKAAHKGKQHTDELAHAIEHMVGHWVSVLGAIETVKKAAEKYFEILKEHREEEESFTRRVDTGMTRYAQVQKLKQADIPEAATRIGEQAVRASASPEQAAAAATMLGEFGFSNKEATGDALEELLKFQSTTSGAGGDSQDFSRQVLEILKRSGAKRDPGSIKRLGGFVTQLTGKAAGFDAGMLGEYSAVATAATAGGLTQEQGLALYAALRENEDKPRKALTQFKEWMKPGMQKGEADARKRAAELTGQDFGQAQYDAVNELYQQSLPAREQKASTGKAFAEYSPGLISSQEAHDNLLRALRAESGGTARPVKEAIESMSLSAYEFLTGDTQEAVEMYANPSGTNDQRSRTKIEQRRERILGKEPIPMMTIRLKGQDGRDTPHSVEASGIEVQ